MIHDGLICWIWWCVIILFARFDDMLLDCKLDGVNWLWFKLRCSLRMYNSLVEKCFNDCVDTFKHKSLQKQEETCVRRCAEKFLKHSMRVGMRFAELNQGAATQDWSLLTLENCSFCLEYNLFKLYFFYLKVRYCRGMNFFSCFECTNGC